MVNIPNENQPTMTKNNGGHTVQTQKTLIQTPFEYLIHGKDALTVVHLNLCCICKRTENAS